MLSARCNTRFYRKDDNMKKILCVMMLVLMVCSAAWADVAINAENFPDDEFRNFLLFADEQLLNGDGWLDDDELKNLYSMNVEGAGIIESLKGIEYFTELRELYCGNNKISELDLNGNQKLISLDCWGNNLAALDVSMCKDLKYLDCQRNYMRELNISGCDNLRELYCSDNSLNALDVSNFKNLVSLDCRNAPLMTELNVSGCSELAYLQCGSAFLSISGSGRLQQLDVSECPKLQKLYCAFNQISELNIANNRELVYLNCENNYLSILNVSNNTKLERITCSNNQITELNIANNKELVYLNCTWNRLTALDIRSNTKLVTLYCDDNELTELDLSRNNRLKELQCTQNRFAVLNLGGLNLSPDEVIAGQQIVGHLVLTRNEENASYPYRLDFTGYMTPSQTGNIIASSVKGFDDDNSAIDTVYSAGTAQFASIPSMVRYSYTTGLGALSIDITIVDDDFLSITLNNHVYRVFPHGMNWDNAKAYCESLGGHLATVTSEEERELLEELCRRARERLGYSWAAFWMGGELRSIGAEEDRWLWITGEEFTETVSDDEPRTDEAIPRYSDIFFHNLGMYNGYLTPGLSTFPYGFICEWKPASADFIPFLPTDTTHRDEDFTGYVQDPRDLTNLMSDPPKVGVPITLPAKFDPREEGRKLPEIRNQGQYATCWSFASIGALEASYMTKFGKTADLSELHQAWYVFKDTRDGYSQPMDTAVHALNQGGYAALSVHFLSGIGPASENSMEYNTATISNIENLTKGRYPENYPHPIRLSDAYELGNIDATNREAMMKIVKNLVYEYGAIEVCYNTSSKDPGYNASTTSYYLPDSVERTGGHAVQIVGWDDNYSHTKFEKDPGINGAWLTKNSWGTNWGDKGFFWLSYGQTLYNVSVFIASESTNAKMYGHDHLSARYAANYRWGASVFRASTNESLNAVSFYTRNNNIPYKIYINVHGNTEPTKADFTISETPSAEGTQDYAGYHTVNLSKPIQLKAGEYFSVIVNLGGVNPLMVMENDNDSGNDMTSVITTAGKSYFSNSTSVPEAKEWTDGKNLINGSFNGSIRAFTVNGSGEDVTAVNITTTSLPDGTVGKSYNAALSATGSGSIKWTVSGLPDGLSCEGNVIKGIPTSAGTFSVSITAENAAGTDSKRLDLTIKNASDPDTPGTSLSSGGGGGGGCNSLSVTAIIGAVIMAFTLKRKK